MYHLRVTKQLTYLLTPVNFHSHYGSDSFMIDELLNFNSQIPLSKIWNDQVRLLRVSFLFVFDGGGPTGFPLSEE